MVAVLYRFKVRLLTPEEPEERSNPLVGMLTRPNDEIGVSTLLIFAS